MCVYVIDILTVRADNSNFIKIRDLSVVPTDLYIYLHHEMGIRSARWGDKRMDGWIGWHTDHRLLHMYAGLKGTARAAENKIL